MVVTSPRHRGSSRFVLAAVITLAAVLSFPRQAQAHGGDEELRLMGQPVGGYDVTVMTAPKAPRVGDLHIAVQLVDPDKLKYVREAAVIATARLLEGASTRVARDRAQYHEPWHEAHLRLQESGRWKVNLSVSGPKGEGETSFIVDVAPTTE